MLLIAAAAIASVAPQEGSNGSVRAIVQARATMRIISAARIQWDEKANAETPPVKAVAIQTASGRQPAKLVEFE